MDIGSGQRRCGQLGIGHFLAIGERLIAHTGQDDLQRQQTTIERLLLGLSDEGTLDDGRLVGRAFCATSWSRTRQWTPFSQNLDRRPL
jgi:hypothetical protein